MVGTFEWPMDGQIPRKNESRRTDGQHAGLPTKRPRCYPEFLLSACNLLKYLKAFQNAACSQAPKRRGKTSWSHDHCAIGQGSPQSAPPSVPIKSKTGEYDVEFSEGNAC